MADPHVILDVGTCNTRIGYGNTDDPPVVFSTIVGEVNSNIAKPMGPGQQTHYVGAQILEKGMRAMLRIDNPVENGRIELKREGRRDMLRHLIDHGVKLLPDSDAPRRLVLMEPTQVTKQEREDLVDFIFSSTNFSELWMACAPACSLFASGRTTGVVLEAGESDAHVVPFLEGHALSRSRWKKPQLSGKGVTTDLEGLLQKNNRLQNRESLPAHILRGIKEKHSFISINKPDDEHLADNDPSLVKLELPDGRELELGEERFRCGEIFFNPNTNISRGGHTSSRTLGIHRIIAGCIAGCDERLQPKLFNNIVTSGGVTLTHGFHARLQKEINAWLNGCGEGMDLKSRCKFSKPLQLVNKNNKCAISTSDKSVCVQAWQGAAILSKLSSFEAMKVTATDVKENGPGCVHRKQMAPARAVA